MQRHWSAAQCEPRSFRLNALSVTKSVFPMDLFSPSGVSISPTEEKIISDDIRKKFWEKLADSPFMMIGLEHENGHSAPMSAQLDKNADGRFWFFASTGSRLSAGGKAMAQFASKGHDLFACVDGTLVQETNNEVIDALWNNSIEAWYEGGRSDPKLLVLRYELSNAEV